MASKQEQAINEMVRRGSLTKQEGAQRVLALRRGPQSAATKVEPLRRHAQSNIDNGLQVNNADGSTSTVRSGSVNHPGLNGGRITLIPFVWDGRVVENPDEAAELAIKSGVDWPTFSSHEEATAASRSLSDSITPSKPLDITQQLNANASPGALTNLVTGNNQETDQIADLPELHLSGLLAGEDPALVAKVTPALITATNPDEIAQIVESNFPNVGRVFTQDAQGNPFPLLVNNANNNATNINRPGLSGFDLLQGGAIGSALFPATRAGSVVKAALGAGGTSAAIQGSQAAVGGEFNPLDVGLDAVLGGAGKALERGGVTARKIADDVPANPAVQIGDELGVPVLTSDVVKPTTFAGRTLQETAEKIPFAGTGPLRAKQQAFRNDAVNEFVEKYNSFSYDSIVASLKEKKQGVRRAAGNTLEKTGNILDAVGDIQLNNTRSAMKKASKELSKPGVIQSSNAMDDLQTLISAIDGAPQTFTSLKENRTAFRDIVAGADKAERSQLPSRAKSLLEAVQKAMTKDMEAHAKANLHPNQFRQWQKANAVYAQESELLKKSRLKNILDKGDVTPEAVSTMLFSQKPSEVKTLFNSLTTSGRENARAVIISKINNDLSKRAGGFTPTGFANELKKYPNQVKTFFRGREKRELEGLRRLLDSTVRAQDAKITTPTGQSALALLGIGGLATDAGTTLAAGATVGGLARLYESAPVRNVLVRLAGASASTFDQALLNAQSVITAAGQAILNEEQEPPIAQ